MNDYKQHPDFDEHAEAMSKLKERWLASVPKGPASVRYSDRVKKALAVAGWEAEKEGRRSIGTVDVLFGLLLAGGEAAVILNELGLEVETLREIIHE